MKKSWILLLLLLLVAAMAVPVSANSAEPPGMIVLSNDLPENAVLTLLSSDGQVLELRQITHSNKAWESQYRLWFPLDFQNWDGARLCVTVENDSFSCPLPEVEGSRYNTVVTLDYQNQTLVLGQSPWRQPLLTALRVILTLLSEGLVFYLFGFREKRSWLVFAGVNLLTQGWLNIVLNGYAFSSGYILLSLVGMELCIFLTEAVVFPIAIRERKIWHRILSAFVGNAVSLALGIFLLGWLPL